jgi:hypothetical protein
MYATQIAKKAKAFCAWLTGAGAEVLEPTSEWELVRFKSGGETSIIYRNAAGGVKYTGAAGAAYKAFTENKTWRALPATRRKKSSPIIRVIRKRDGDLCFFCQDPVSEEVESAEHLVSVTHGGPNHISNMFLSHRVCNAIAGHLSAPEKIAKHVKAILQKKEKTHQ